MQSWTQSYTHVMVIFLMSYKVYMKARFFDVVTSTVLYLLFGLAGPVCNHSVVKA